MKGMEENSGVANVLNNDGNTSKKKMNGCVPHIFLPSDLKYMVNNQADMQQFFMQRNTFRFLDNIFFQNMIS